VAWEAPRSEKARVALAAMLLLLGGGGGASLWRGGDTVRRAAAAAGRRPGWGVGGGSCVRTPGWLLRRPATRRAWVAPCLSACPSLARWNHCLRLFTDRLID
jgi:hypothetical protein